jgi:hypothetical protein
LGLRIAQGLGVRKSIFSQSVTVDIGIEYHKSWLFVDMHGRKARVKK